MAHDEFRRVSYSELPELCVTKFGAYFPGTGVVGSGLAVDAG